MELLQRLGAKNIRTRTKANGQTEIHCDCLSDITGHVQESGNSASLNIDKELFSCFSCGAGFNVPQLLLYSGEAFTWEDALKKARKYVDALPEVWTEISFNAVEYGDNKPEWWQPELNALEVMAFAKKGHTYLTKPKEEGGRGIEATFWRNMGVHFNPDVGAIRFPCVDHVGRLVGYIDRPFRPLGDNKYTNSPGPWRNFVLYGYFHALKAIKSGKFDYIIVVEGPGDVIALHSMGFTNVVATLGVKCSQFQVDLLAKITTKVLLGFDNDKYGYVATDRFLKMAEGKFKNIKIGSYFAAIHDPGDLAGNPEALDYFINAAITPIEREIQRARARRQKKVG